LGVEHRSLSNSVYIFLHSHVVLFIQGPNILQNIINHHKNICNRSNLYVLVQWTTPSISQANLPYCLCWQLA